MLRALLRGLIVYWFSRLLAVPRQSLGYNAPRNFHLSLLGALGHNNYRMKITLRQKQFIFFYLVYNLIGYLSFLFDFTPFISTKSSLYLGLPHTSNYYIITPDMANVKDCSNYTTPSGFYPFHEYTFSCIYYGLKSNSTFVGLWGFYDHTEFAVYVLLPLFAFALYLLYKKLVVGESINFVTVSGASKPKEQDVVPPTKMISNESLIIVISVALSTLAIIVVLL